MPEFIMENALEAARTESEFVFGFIEVLFFTETSPAYMSDSWFTDTVQRKIIAGQSDGNLPGDVGYSDLHPDSLERIRKFCEAWQAKHADLLKKVYEETDYTKTQCGRDFFYTHVGHGVGFSDRKELADRQDLIDALNEAAGNGEVCPYYGDPDEPFVHVDLY